MPSAAPARPADEFRAAFDLFLDLVSRHPGAGPKVAAPGIAGRAVFPDLKVVLNVAPSAPKLRKKGIHLAWGWGPPPKGFVAGVLVSCPSTLAIRLAVGKENPALAIDRGELTLTPLDPSVDARRLLDLLPVLVPLRAEVVALLGKAGLGRLAG